MTTFIDESTESEFLRMLEDLSVPKDNVQRLDPPMPRTIEDMGVVEGDEEAIDEAKRSLETILALSRGDHPSEKDAVDNESGDSTPNS